MNSNDESDADRDGACGSDDASPDRRKSDRYLSICRIARVRRANDMGLWRVQNISDKGMMLAANIPLAGGEEVEIALSESIAVSGRIVWADGTRCGVTFSEPINAAQTLAALAKEQQTEGYRALRLPVEIRAILTLRDGAMPIDLVDVSQSGAGFRSGSLLQPGAELDILLPGQEQTRRALVRWSRGGRGGLWFINPLDLADLQSIALLESSIMPAANKPRIRRAP